MVSEKENREKLFQLMRENPELPVVAMVDSEIVADDGYNRWLGVWGCSYIGEYLVGEEQVHFREDDDPSEVDKVLSGGERGNTRQTRQRTAGTAENYQAKGEAT